MISVNDFLDEKTCVYKGEEYLVRDNGAVLRKTPPSKKPRKLDNVWTFGKLNDRTGYLELASVRIHRIVATAFHGAPPTDEYVVDHIDTNKQNNRPSNLRWLTRLENVVFNPVTRTRIEYCTGVSITEFLKNPAAYRDAFSEPNISWMRRVTEEEAKACLEKFTQWSEQKSKKSLSQSDNRSQLGEWVFRPQTTNPTNRPQIQREGTPPTTSRLPQIRSNITDSLTPNAKQKNWKTPMHFVLCPTTISGNPIDCYAKNLSENAEFATNQYGSSNIVKYVTIENDAILIITTTSSSIKPLALAKITYENEYFLHTSLGSFFTEEGAEKQFVLAQGLEWTGGDSIDDYC